MRTIQCFLNYHKNCIKCIRIDDANNHHVHCRDTGKYIRTIHAEDSNVQVSFPLEEEE